MKCISDNNILFNWRIDKMLNKTNCNIKETLQKVF